MKTIMKKVLSVLMVLAILLVPMTVMAEDAALGSYDNPYYLELDAMRIAVTVEPEADAYVKVSDQNNTIVTVGYATGDYFIGYGKQTIYNNPDEERTATLTMAAEGYDFFLIHNTSTENSITAYITLTAGEAVDTTGTMDNPEVLELSDPWGTGSLAAFSQKALDAGNEGHYYKVVAPADGAIAVSVNAYNPDDFSSVGWLFNANNITASIYGEYYTSADETPIDVQFVPVSANDEVVIFASTYDPEDMWNNPAGTVSVNVTYVAKGSYEYPDEITETGDIATDVEAGTWGYYYTYVATEAGKATVTMNDDTWQYQVNVIPADEEDYGSYVYGEAHMSVDEDVVASESVIVNAGDKISVMVNTLNPEDTWNAPAGTVNWSFDFAAIDATFSIDDTDAFIGKEFDVVVNVSDNTGIISAALEIGYDADVLELVAVKAGDFAATNAEVVVDDQIIVGEDGYSFGPNTLNPIRINWIDALAKENVTTNGTFAVLTFKVKDDAIAGDTKITVDYDPNNVFDKDFNNVDFVAVDATVTVKSHTPGDVNADGKVNNRDYALVMQYINKWDVTIVEAAADVNADGKINNRDYALIMQYINKWDVELQ